MILPGMPLMFAGPEGYALVGVTADTTGAGTLIGRTVTLSPHVNTLPGDLLIAYVVGNAASSQSAPALLTGWTAKEETSGAYLSRLMTRVREMGGSSYAFTAACNSMGVVLLSFRSSSGVGNSSMTAQGAGAVNANQVTSTTPGSDLIAVAGIMTDSISAPVINSFPASMEELTRSLSPSASRRTLVWAGIERTIAGGNTGTRAFDFSAVSRTAMIEVKK